MPHGLVRRVILHHLLAGTHEITILRGDIHVRGILFREREQAAECQVGQYLPLDIHRSFQPVTL